MSPRSLDMALAVLQHWATGAPPRNDLGAHITQTSQMLLGTGTSAQPGYLESIFNRMEQSGRSPLNAYLKPNGLRLDREVLFPTNERPASDQQRTRQEQRLHAEIAQLTARNLGAEALLEGVLFALQRHAWALPSPLPAVSLYDLARTHAALAAALADQPDAQVALVGGDISGVQDFIYSVTASGAAKQLRGRSLYLQLLTDACAHAVLQQAGMPLCNLLYAGGGHFYALVPAAALETIGTLRRQIGKKLLDAHHGSLYLALGGVAFAPAAYSQETWADMSAAIETDKRRRFAALDVADFQNLFCPHQPEPPREEDVDEPLDPMEQSLEQLGATLSRTTLLVAEPGSMREQQEEAWYGVLSNLGLGFRPVDEVRRYRGGARGQRLLMMSDEGNLHDLTPGPKDVVGTRYTVTEAPLATQQDVERFTALGLQDDENGLLAGHVLPFNLLAEYADGVKRIGVLRMDVDNLGDLFGSRLKRPAGVSALVYTSALSSALSRFFEGWVGQLCRTINDQRTDAGVYAVYSGGDDLFLVGSWHLIPDLAYQIREDFAAYVLGRKRQSGERPPITLSAGITLHGGSYPLYQAAGDAGEALDKAKGLVRPDGHAKDAITFLGRTLGWDEFAQARDLCAHLIKLVTDQGAPRALLMTIQSLDTKAQATQRCDRNGTPKLTYGPWVWQGAYQLTRMAGRGDQTFGKAIEDLRERLVGAEGVRNHFIHVAGMAARWAQLRIRHSRTSEEA